MELTSTRKPVARAACSLLLLLAAASMARAGAVFGPDRIWRKNIADPLPGTITDESVDGIKVGAGATIQIANVTRVDYADAPEAYRRGHDRRQQGLYAEAIKYFETAITNKMARKFWLEPACRYYIALSYLEEGRDLAAAEAKFREFLKEHPKARLLPDGLLGLGRALHAAGKFDAAIVQFKKLLDLALERPGWEEWAATAYVWTARAHLEADRPDEAMRNVKKVLAALVDPKHDLVIQAKTIEAMILLRQDKAKEAIALLQELIKQIAPRVAEEIEDGGGFEIRMQRTESQCYNALGQAYLKLHARSRKNEDLREALLAFLWTVVLYPRSQFAAEHAEALFHAAQCFERLKQRNRATELLNELQERYPDNPYNRAPGAGKAGAPRKETEK